MTRRTAATPALLLFLLAGCGAHSGSAISLPSLSPITRSAAPARTAEPPATGEPADPATTRPPTKAPATTQPPTKAPTTNPPTTTAAPETTRAPTAAPTTTAPAATASSGSGDDWVWWLVGAAVVLLLVGIALLWQRSRHKAVAQHTQQAWRDGYTRALSECVWLARDLLPVLAAAATREEQAGGWRVARARSVGLVTNLDSLQASAPDELAALRSSTLLAAVRMVSLTLDTPAAPPPGTPAQDLSAVRRQLDDALTSVQPAPPDPSS